MRISSLDFFDGSRRVVAVDGRLPVLNGGSLSDAHPASVRVFFTNADSQQVKWTGRRIVTVRHGMGCYPFVQVYDSSMSLVRPIEKVVDGGTVMLDFAEDVEIDDGSPWCCVVSYGSEYSEAGGVQDGVAASAAMAASNMTAAQNARDGAVSERDDAGVYAGLASQALSELEGVVGSLSLPSVSAAMVYAALGQCTVDAVGQRALVKWTDPNPYSVPYGKVWTWKATIVVSNPDHAPTSVSDGTVVAECPVWNSHSSTPLEVPFDGETYIRLFTRMYDGRVSDASLSPSRHFVMLDVSDLDGYMRELRAGNIEQLSAMFPVGSTLGYVSHSGFASLSYLVGHYDYKGHCDTVEEYLNENGHESETWGEVRHHNVILIPQNGLSNPNGSPASIPYDLPELLYAPTQDVEFQAGKTYYVDSTCTEEYAGATTGSPVELGLHERGRALPPGGDTVSHTQGCSMYHESTIRQWLTSFEAAGEWYSPLNIFEPASHEFTEGNDGFLRGFDPKTKVYLHKAHVRHDLYDGTDVVTWDMCFLPNRAMMAMFNEYPNGNTKKERLDYYNSMTAWAQRTVRDVNGNAVYGYTGDGVDDIETLWNLSTNPTTLAKSWLKTTKLIGSTQSGKLPFICLA